MSDQLFLGQGMKFPPQINPANGRIAFSNGAENIKESLYLILMTNLGERITRPGFGSSLNSYTFMETNMTNINFLIRTLTQEIQSQEPRIQDVDITVDAVTRQGCLIIDIGYTIIETNVEDNLVFPFYLDNVIEEDEYDTTQYQNGGDYYESTESNE